MRKYLRVTIIVALFFVLIFVTRLKGIQPVAQTQSLAPVQGALAPTAAPQVPAPTAAALRPSAETATVPPPTPRPTSAPNDPPTPTTTTPSPSSSGYIDGVYTHRGIELHGGFLQLEVTFAEGRMEDITFLQHPHASNTSQVINEKVLPRLRKKALENQRARIDFISGASTTCNAFDWALSVVVRRATPDA